MFKPGLVTAIIFIKAILLALSVTGCAPAEYDIEAEANPKDAGEVSGEGTFEEGEEVTLEAMPAEGYELSHWEENGEKISSSVEYTFKVESDRSLVASYPTLCSKLSSYYQAKRANNSGSYEFSGVNDAWWFAPAGE